MIRPVDVGDWDPRDQDPRRAAPGEPDPPSRADLEDDDVLPPRCQGSGEIAVNPQYEPDTGGWVFDFFECPGCPDCEGLR